MGAAVIFARFWLGAAFAGAFAAPAHADLYYLVIAGLGGEPKYQEQFDKATNDIAAVARRTAGNDKVMVLQGESATRAAVMKAFESLRTRTKPADSLAVVMVGHGSFDGDTYKFNLPGPDIDGAELKRLLGAVPAKSQLVVNATSASGAVLDSWAGDGRAVITATRSGFERNATRFAELFAAALAEGAADINKNGIITAQEAFDYASRSVAESFTTKGTLATEHPQMKGGGAARFTVARLGGAATVPSNPQVAALTAERERLDGEIESLKDRREQMQADAYLDQLQTLLVQLADVQGKIDAAQGKAQ
jgi:hypothetical protein